jgi:hypothetical protein
MPPEATSLAGCQGRLSPAKNSPEAKLADRAVKKSAPARTLPESAA